MSLTGNNAIVGSGFAGNQPFSIDQSLRFNDGDSPYLSRTAGTATSNDIGTLSFWAKRGEIGGGKAFFSNHADSSNRTYVGFDADKIQMYGKISNSTNVELVTTQVFRDPSAWYHIVIAVDVTQATSTNRVKIYVNGSQITSFSTATYPAQNTDLPLFSKTNHQVGAFFSSSVGDYYDGYLAEFHYIDGQALTPDSFGKTDSDTNQWVAKYYDGTYGTNGFYLPFSSEELANSFTDSIKYTVQSFTNTGSTTWTAPSGVTSVEYLVVAGGGAGGGGYYGGGGGAGGMLTGTHSVTPGNSYTVTVGAGGAGTSSSNTNGSNGSDSVFDSITANGGGGGGAYQQTTPTGGGSGGGGGRGGNGAAGTSGQGNAGGNGNGSASSGGGGGGGAGAVGGAGAGSGGSGGVGLPSTITGTSTYYAGGGGGGSYNQNNFNNGGQGGGGTGNFDNPAGSGTANTGGGGGGASVGGNPSGAGGSGIVVVRYLNAAGATSGNTLTANGDVSHSNSQKKIGRSSIEFVYSSNSYLSTGFSSDFAFGTGAYTFEAWLYPTSQSATYAGIMGNYISSGSDFGTFLEITGGKWSVYVPSTRFDTGVTASLNAWSHVALVREGTGSNELKLYVNGSSIWTGTDSQNTTNTYKALISGIDLGASYAFNGYMDEIRISNSARYTGTFTPSTTAFTVDSNTKLLIHSDFDGGLGSDSSGNQNDFVSTNITLDDQVMDSPMNNFATLNPLATQTTPLSEGNLRKSTSDTKSNMSTIGVSSGKWYWEVYPETNNWGIGLVNDTETRQSASGSTTVAVLFSDVTSTGTPNSTETYDNFSSVSAGDIISIALDVDSETITFYQNNTRIFEADTFTIDGPFFPAIDRGTSATNNITINFGQESSFAGSKTSQGNGGVGEDFYYTPPTGYKALNTDNLPDPAIALSGDHFNTVLYTGNNTDGRSITGVGFEPNFVWQKNRSSSLDHILYDNVRTIGKELRTNSTVVETFSGYISSFNSDGFTVNTGGSGIANSNGGSHVAWNWKGSDTPSKTFAVTVTNPGSGNRYTLDGKVSGTNAMPITIEEGGTYTFDQAAASNSGHPLRFSTTANGTHGGGSEYTTGVTTNGTPGNAGAYTRITVAASAPTLYYYCTNHSGMGAEITTPAASGGVSDLSGTIPSVTNTNTAAGFSVVSYSGNATAGATVGHGLSQAPEIIFIKERTHQDSWLVFSEPVGNTKMLELNATNAAATHTTYWNDTSPSATVVTLGSDNKGNGTGTMIMYCFHSVEGYSKVGGYSGNGSADGAFLYTGFRPQWLLVKETGAAGNWLMWDVKRSEFNVMDDYLVPNDTAADRSNAAVSVDFVSNGFKWRTTDDDMNGGSGSYIYMAFAETPFKYANAR